MPPPPPVTSPRPAPPPVPSRRLPPPPPLPPPRLRSSRPNRLSQRLPSPHSPPPPPRRCRRTALSSISDAGRLAGARGLFSPAVDLDLDTVALPTGAIKRLKDRPRVTPRRRDSERVTGTSTVCVSSMVCAAISADLVTLVARCAAISADLDRLVARCAANLGGVGQCCT